MLLQLKKMGAEGTFLPTIKAIYTKQKAKIKINSQTTEDIQIEQGRVAPFLRYYLF